MARRRHRCRDGRPGRRRRRHPRRPGPWLLVLKLEAFADRGNDDVLQSRDLEDIALLVDDRDKLGAESPRSQQTLDATREGGSGRCSLTA
ncbi:hypothetical protein NBH00_10795 [Paraconexibacter antarcticus]|uniref:Uncharacterized protein n=1 Tax=Paraconexibacter antarcticus TaxID=2949664 RepID=A0ABY5E1F9_9ACTN|nr:hypothetical protein [Paraconexibacter antarcticus]UTI66672.1 hypothetical protein NBH00_10795 [Paraconexibacter antarcticus]